MKRAALRAFIWYIAASAHRSSPSDESASSGARAIPMLTHAATGCGSVVNGRDSKQQICVDSAASDSRSGPPVMSTANSSPPVRATVVHLSLKIRSRSANPQRASSPAAGPQVSLMGLKASQVNNHYSDARAVLCQRLIELFNKNSADMQSG